MEQELTHHGIKGMKWGVRRTPEQLARASGRLAKQNEKLQKKIPSYNFKSAYYDAKSARYGDRYIRTAARRHLTDFGYAKERRLLRKASRMRVKATRFKSAAVRAENKIRRNQKLMASFDTKIKELDTERVNLGADFVKTMTEDRD